MKIPIHLLSFFKNQLTRLGVKLVYAALLMYFAFQNEKTPFWAKRIILGAITYLISPIDGIPDFSPVIGFTDDMSVVVFCLVNIACYINVDVRENACKQLKSFFTTIHEKDLQTIDKLL